jgi:hypothetical protein
MPGLVAVGSWIRGQRAQRHGRGGTGYRLCILGTVADVEGSKGVEAGGGVIRLLRGCVFLVLGRFGRLVVLVVGFVVVVSEIAEGDAGVGGYGVSAACERFIRDGHGNSKRKRVTQIMCDRIDKTVLTTYYTTNPPTLHSTPPPSVLCAAAQSSRPPSAAP